MSGVNELIKKTNESIDKYKGHIFLNMSPSLFPKEQDKLRFINNVMSCVRKNPKLAECSTMTLLGSIIECATIGLVPDGITGLAHLVPFKDKIRGMEAQLIIGYKGYRKLALRNPNYVSFEMRAVYNTDTFDYEFGLNPYIKHKTNTNKVDKIELTHVYAYVVTVSGYKIFDVMTREQVDVVKNKTKKGDRLNPVWIDHYDSMAMKTVANRLATKQLDLEADVARVFANDDMAMNGMSQKNDTNVPTNNNEFVEAEYTVISQKEADDNKSNLDDKSNAAMETAAKTIEKPPKSDF